jgi:hypothetical protein
VEQTQIITRVLCGNGRMISAAKEENKRFRRALRRKKRRGVIYEL